jgi:glucosyl-3-phosphoglycerate synthase
MERVQLLDRIVVVDSGSSDDTLARAAEAGAEVIIASEILPKLAAARGKGENLYKATYAVDADILCFLDGDIRQMDPRFVCGLVGPLLYHSEIQFVKAYYDRPTQAAEEGSGNRPQGGGRVTEILVRPLFSLFRPNLSQIIQPLSGEYAARRSLLRQLPFPVGYGVEMAHLLEIESRFGMEVIAQTDLEERIHRHHGTAELGRMAFAILQVFIRRLPPQALTLFPEGNLPDIYRTFLMKGEVYEQVIERHMELELPPLNTLDLS